MDPEGRPGFAYESPSSRSGDWYLVTTHYFDTTGTTLLVERHASFFNGCWDEKGDSIIAVRETLTSYYRPDRRLARRDLVRTAFDTTIAAPSTNCNTTFQEPFPVYASWPSLAKAMGIAPIVRAR